MSTAVDARIQLKRDTTEHWNNAAGFVPLQGEVIIYTDYMQQEKEVGGILQTVNIPGIKIGDGNAYVQDLPFVGGDIRNMLLEHIHNADMHIALGERDFWNNKINVDDAYEAVHDELVDETLILNRN